MSDEIDADTAPMVQYQVNGPKFADPEQPVVSRLTQGIAFARAEQQAAQNVKNFARAANFGMKDYVDVANRSGRDYFDSDAAGRAVIENVTKG